MIRLEHLNIVVSNMQDTLAFYQAAFPHWRIRDQGTYSWFGHPRTWLHFGDDYNYISFNDNGSGVIRDQKGSQIGLSHFGFVVDSLSALKKRMQDSGFTPSQQGAEHPYRRNSYYFDPNGFEVEFVEYLSDIPSLRNASVDETGAFL